MLRVELAPFTQVKSRPLQATKYKRKTMKVRVTVKLSSAQGEGCSIKFEVFKLLLLTTIKSLKSDKKISGLPVKLEDSHLFKSSKGPRSSNFKVLFIFVLSPRSKP